MFNHLLSATCLILLVMRIDEEDEDEEEDFLGLFLGYLTVNLFSC